MVITPRKSPLCGYAIWVRDALLRKKIKNFLSEFTFSHFYATILQTFWYKMHRQSIRKFKTIKKMKSIYKPIGFLFILSIIAFTSCEKNETLTTETPVLNKKTVEATIDYEKPYTEVLTAEKNHYSVGEHGKVYTSRSLLYSLVYSKITLTKVSQRNVARFSMSENESEYILTVNRIKAPVDHTKFSDGLCINNPKNVSTKVLDAILEGYAVEVCFDKETEMWYWLIDKE